MTYTESSIADVGRILVTGSGGFIGTHLVDKLHSIRANLFEIRNRVDCDLRDFEAVRTRLCLVNPSVVIHLAASPDTGKYISDDYQSFHNTFICTLNVLHAISSLSTLSEILFIHIGSYKQYGNRDVPFREDDTVNPVSAYGAAKHIAEELTRFYENTRFKVVFLRMGSVFGPQQSQRYLIPHTICSILNKRTENLMVTDVLWDPIYVSDAIEAICSCIVQPKAWGRIINISGGIPYTPKDIMYCIAGLMGASIQLKQYEQSGANRPLDCLGDIRLAEHLLGWKPSTSLSQGLRLTIDSFLKSCYEVHYLRL